VHSGTLFAFGKHSEDGRGVYRIGSRRELRDAWRLGGLPEVVYCLGTRGQMASSGGFRGDFRLNLRVTWRVPKEGPKGLFRRRVEKGAFGEMASG